MATARRKSWMILRTIYDQPSSIALLKTGNAKSGAEWQGARRYRGSLQGGFFKRSDKGLRLTGVEPMAETNSTSFSAFGANNACRQLGIEERIIAGFERQPSNS